MSYQPPVPQRPLGPGRALRGPINNVVQQPGVWMAALAEFASFVRSPDLAPDLRKGCCA